MDIKDLIKEKGVKNKLFDDWVSSASNALEVLGDSISNDDLKKILQYLVCVLVFKYYFLQVKNMVVLKV